MKFGAGDFLLDDAPQLGRPVEVDSGQIETLIENNQHYSMRGIADILKISKSIKLLVKIKNVSFILWKKLNRLFGQTIFLRSGPTYFENLVKMKYATNNLDTFILLTVDNSSLIPCVHWERSCECFCVQSGSQGFTELLYVGELAGGWEDKDD